MKCLLAGAITCLLTACVENTFETHNTHFEPLLPHGMEFYADQNYDSIKVFSYDPWTAKTEGPDSWFSINPDHCDARPGSSALTRIDVKMPQNTSGKNKKGYIVVNTYDNNSISMAVSQHSWLNIMYPTPYITGDTYEEKTATFPLRVLAGEKQTEITFQVFQEGATLTSDADWISFTTSTFSPGVHSLKLDLQPNTDKEKRQANLTLTSGEISSTIKVTQEGKKEDK